MTFRANLLLTWAVPMSFRLGPFRLSVFGAVAVLGVLLAMTVAGRGARRSGYDPAAAWDVGLFAVLSCFVASRLLLVLRDPVAFARFPWLVLALPSLTLGGLAIAAILVGIYLYRKHLPVLPTLDVFAPAGAVLAAALELGHWLDGSEPGMPLGFLDRGRRWDLAALRLYPVALLGAAIAGALTIPLLFTLGRRGRRPGQVAGLGLALGGAAAFALSLLSLPDDVLSAGWLEPGQMVALGACAAGALLWSFAPPTPVHRDAAKTHALAQGSPLSLAEESR